MAVAGLIASTLALAPVFGPPVIVGSSNRSTAHGGRFWVPGIAIATGLHGHAAVHITLADDGGPCPSPTMPGQACEQIVLTRDGGLTYTTVKKIGRGTSGCLNGYGDLGTHVPSPPAPPGRFNALVGCNDCWGTGHGEGGAMGHPWYLQTWQDDGETLRVVANRSIAFEGTPAVFAKSKECPGPPTARAAAAWCSAWSTC